MKQRKGLLIILDGLGDRPIKEFGGKTPLEYANTPNMDSSPEWEYSASRTR